jgi:hypothetical protein
MLVCNALSQDASTRLYLCVLLRSKPLLAEAIVMALNGARFLDVYVHEVGLELRVQVDEIVPGPVAAKWDGQAKCALGTTHRLHPLCGRILGFLHLFEPKIRSTLVSRQPEWGPKMIVFL